MIIFSGRKEYKIIELLLDIENEAGGVDGEGTDDVGGRGKRAKWHDKGMDAKWYSIE